MAEGQNIDWQALKQELKELKQELQKKDEAMKALKDDMNRELKKRDDELKLKLEEKDQQVRKSAAEVTALKKQLQETDQKFSAMFNTLSTTCLPTYHLTMANYAELKGNNSCWDSECFYTHPGGYQCFIRVWPNGRWEGCDTHVSVELYSAPGQFDGTLPWPAKATFTLQLLNQHRDQDHVTVTERFQWKTPRGNGYVGIFSSTFILHAELDWNAEKQTKYLHEDCLRFKMAKIEIFLERWSLVTSRLLLKAWSVIAVTFKCTWYITIVLCVVFVAIFIAGIIHH